MSLLSAFKKRPASSSNGNQGTGVVIQMPNAAPEVGDQNAKGYTFTGTVMFSYSPDIKRGDEISVTVRPSTPQNTILSDLAQSKADRLVLLEGVRKNDEGAYIANWVHDGNRHVQASVADLPTVHFVDPDDTSRHLSISVDGRDWTSSRSKRLDNGERVADTVSYEELKEKLKRVVNNNGKFSVSQNVYHLNQAVAVSTEEELTTAAKSFEGTAGAIVLRTFVAGTTDPNLVSLKYAFADQTTKAFKLADVMYEDAATKRIAEAAEKGAQVGMEVIPMERLFYAGQNDRPSKSTKHAVARRIADTSEKVAEFNRSFGPIATQVLIRAAGENNKPAGLLSRFIIDGQHGNVRSLKTANFEGASQRRTTTSEKTDTADSTAAAAETQETTAGPSAESNQEFEDHGWNTDELPDDLGPGM
jgi:hypothetical protein